VGSQQAGDATRDAQRQVIDAEDVAVPPGDAAQLDDRRHFSRSSDFTRKVKIQSESPKRPTSTAADQYQGQLGPAKEASISSVLRPGRRGTRLPICCQAACVF